MPKRSLNPGGNDARKIDAKKIEQLNRAVDALLAQPHGKPPKAEASLESLVRVAADLRELPGEDFKVRLKSGLLGGRKSMSTVAEPVAAVRASASPRLTFKDAAKAIDFYKQAFGARETFRFELESGIPHAVIMIGDSAIMLTEEWPEGGRFSPETLGNSPVMMSLSVPDVDKFFAHAIGAGAKAVIPVADQFYGHREGTLRDPFGYLWSVSTVIEEMPVEEMHRRMKGVTNGDTAGKKPAVNPVPRGFRTVTPYLVAEDGPALLEFAKQVFGAEETFRTVTPAGGLHAEARIGDSMLMVGGGIPGNEFRSTAKTHAIHIYVEEADAVCKKALAAGATLIDEPRDQEYGERSGSVKDPAGNIWYIATHKGESYIAKGLNNVNAYLLPLRAEPVITFLKRAFGAQELAKYASPDGVVHHAEIRVGDSVVEMGEAYGPHSKYEPMPAMFYVYVPDCDAVYQRALASGAKSIQAPTDHPYGDRSGGVTDPFGNTWYIATHVKNMTT
jgi:PhnB protein